MAGSIKTAEERARLWDVVANQRLYILAPARKGGKWMARTNGGAHDKKRLMGEGRTPEEAVSNIRVIKGDGNDE